MHFTRGEGTEGDCRSTMRKTKPWFGGFGTRSWYSMVFKLHGKRRYGAERMKVEGESRRGCHSKVWTQRRAYLKFLSAATSILCWWRKVLAIRRFRRLKQEATEGAVDPVQDSRANLLGEGGNDTVQPYGTTRARPDSAFGVKSAAIQVYGNSHNSQSGRWTGLIVCVDSPEISCHLGLNIQVNRSSGRHRNTGQRRQYEFCNLPSI